MVNWILLPLEKFWTTDALRSSERNCSFFLFCFWVNSFFLPIFVFFALSLPFFFFFLLILFASGVSWVRFFKKNFQTSIHKFGKGRRFITFVIHVSTTKFGRNWPQGCLNMRHTWETNLNRDCGVIRGSKLWCENTSTRIWSKSKVELLAAFALREITEVQEQKKKVIDWIWFPLQHVNNYRYT